MLEVPAAPLLTEASTVTDFVTFILGAALAYFSYQIYKAFPYARIIFSVLYVASGLVIARAVIIALSIFFGGPTTLGLVSELPLLGLYAVLVYMFFSLRGRIFEVFQPYQTSVVVTGLPGEMEVRFSVDVSQSLTTKPGKTEMVNLVAGVHTISMPRRIERGEEAYECYENVRDVKPGINLIGFEYRKVGAVGNT